MSGIIILDGGMGQELTNRAGGAPHPLWGLHVMRERPELLRAVHDEYFAAGADVATTNTYNAHRDRLANNGAEDQFCAIHRMACEIAVAAREAHGAGLVAGALGPLGASYRPDLTPRPEEAAELYEEVARIQAPYVDLYLCETMSSLDLARGAVMGAGVFGKPVWAAFSVDDEDGTKLRSGEPVADVAGIVADYAPDAVLINCSTPEAVSDALGALTGCGARFGAYANGFTRITGAFLEHNPTVAALSARSDLGPEAYADFAQSWAAAGATIIGGCCEVGPAHIECLNRRLRP